MREASWEMLWGQGRGVQWYPDASILGGVLMSDSDKGPWLLIKLVDDMKVGERVNQLEDSEDLTISLVGQVGALFTPNRRNLAVTPLGRYTVGEALPIEVLSRDRGHTRYFNRKYFIEQLVIRKPKG